MTYDYETAMLMPGTYKLCWLCKVNEINTSRVYQCYVRGTVAALCDECTPDYLKEEVEEREYLLQEYLAEYKKGKKVKPIREFLAELPNSLNEGNDDLERSRRLSGR